ncbi:MAG: methylmalonyl-CoA carboxyltransferase [Ruminococcaceae bacterium]|nr:methylmalonyl-CoA carboxyltransferase [Oscillospiraceae bacterium]
MNTINKLEDLRLRHNELLLAGGEDKIAKQHSAGKLTARERMQILFDEGSFMELDAFAGTDAPCDGVICGYGTVDLRPVFAYAQDFTVMGGSIGKTHGDKIAKVIDLAVKTGAPIVAMPDSGGARIQEGSDALAAMGLLLQKTTMASGVVPQIAAVMGPCAGGSAALAELSDFVLMTKESASLYVSSASAIKGASGETTTAKELGGAAASAETNGNCHLVCEDDYTLLATVKLLLSYLPANNLEDAPAAGSDDINRLSPVLDSLVPDDDAASYDVKTALCEIADAGSVLELMPLFAKNIVTALARLDGQTVGFVANQAQEGGLLSAAAADKATRFVRFCDSFNIPLITLTDTDGYVAEIAQEQAGLARKIAALSYAFAEATVPKLNLILRKAYGSAYVAMGSKHLGADMTFAWPTAQIGVMQADGAAEIVYRKEMQKADDPISARKNFVEAYKETYANPYDAAKRGYVDDVIEPSTTRQRLIAALLMLAGKREVLPAKKHGTMPL